jgi:hypothetical protein
MATKLKATYSIEKALEAVSGLEGTAIHGEVLSVMIKVLRGEDLVQEEEELLDESSAIALDGTAGACGPFEGLQDHAERAVLESLKAFQYENWDGAVASAAKAWSLAMASSAGQEHKIRVEEFILDAEQH